MKSALVLSGGGANGAYEVGVMRALVAGQSPATGRRPIEPSAIASTSIGTFNAAVLLSSLDGSWPDAVEALADVWINRIGTRSHAIRNGVLRFRMNPIDWAASFASDPMGPVTEFAEDVTFLASDWWSRLSGLVAGQGALSGRVAELLDASTFVTPDPSAALLRSILKPERIQSSSVELQATTTNWRTGKLRVWHNREFAGDDAVAIVRASGAIPGIFPAVLIEDEKYVDGGVVLNTPLNPMIDADCDELHVIYLDPATERVPLPVLSSLVEAMSRMFVASFASVMQRDLEVARKVNRSVMAGTNKAAHRHIAIHLYHPSEDIGGALGMLDFHRDRIARLVERGYDDALNHDCAVNGCVHTE